MHQRIHTRIFLIAVMAFLFTPMFLLGQQRTDQATQEATAEGVLDFINPNGTLIVSIQIEVADTPNERARGLMGRTHLKDTAGMLFVFKDADYRVFWMHNTPISLDIMFISSSRRILNIAKMTRPMSDTRYGSTSPAQYVVETVAGFSDRYGIGKGTQIRWRRHP